MSISDNGYNFINNYMDFFNFFDISEELNKKIVKTLYSDIIHSDTYARSFSKSIHKESVEINRNNYNVIEELHINNFTSFVSSHVLKEMRQIRKLLKYNFSIGGIEYQLIFLLLKSSDERIIDKKLKTFIRNLYFLTKYMNSRMKTLKVCFLYSDEEKLKNENKNVLNHNNVNTGVTRSCAINGDIFIYRKEEIVKVFIHELIHSKCIDFSNINANTETLEIIKTMFDIRSDFIISEAYSEFWANIVNTLFVTLDVSKKGFDSFYENFILLHTMEKIFSLHQIVSVLNYMGIKYKELIEGKKVHKYSEGTNIFAYYILKTIWLYFGNDYLKFMKKNNGGNLLNSDNSTKYIKSLVKKTKNHYKNNKLLAMISKMEKRYNKMRNKNDNMQKSLRMTILEQE